MDLKRVAALKYGPAAGMVRTVEQVAKLCQSSVPRIKVGTFTRKRREGNKPIPGGRVYYFDAKTGSSYNALGMPNVGIHEFRTMLIEMVRLAHAVGKELWVSVAGESPREFFWLAVICFACGADGVELNLGCPNVHDGGKAKPVFSYHPEMVREILEHMMRFYGEGRQIAVKISPVPNNTLVELVHVISRCDVVTEVTATNTLPGKETTDEYGNPALAFIPPGGTDVIHTGGLSGALLKPESLRVVRELRSQDERAKAVLYPRTKLTVAGSISTGADLMEYWEAAHGEIDGFECGLEYYEHEDPKIFDRINNQFVGHLQAA